MYPLYNELLVIMTCLEFLVLENLIFWIGQIVLSAALNDFFKVGIFPNLFYAFI